MPDTTTTTLQGDSVVQTQTTTADLTSFVQDAQNELAGIVNQQKILASQQATLTARQNDILAQLQALVPQIQQTQTA